MHRSLPAIFVSAMLGCAGVAGAASSPAPTAPKAVPKSSGLSNKVHKPGGMNSHVSALACNRRGVGVNAPQNALGPNGASTSTTIVAVPIGGGNAATATRQRQIDEACAHQRR